MGRHKKTVLTKDGLDRREKGYYSTPCFVTKFITEELISRNQNGQTVLDPCVGREEMVWAFVQSGKTITGWDIEDLGVHKIADYKRRDFLKFYGKLLDSRLFDKSINLPYDYYVANPPYNCHESQYIRENKKWLQRIFSQVGVANMYSMFMSAMIHLAKPGAVLGIITNDSFLTSRVHQSLREQILESCSITHLLLCPVDLFHSQGADVRTCIIVLVKGEPKFNYSLAVLNRPKDTASFARALHNRDFEIEAVDRLVLRSSQDRKEFVVGCPSGVREMFRLPRIGERFRCVTGISTGNDSKYIRKNADASYTVPFYKNPGKRRFYMEPDGYLPKHFLGIAKNVPTFMVRNRDLLFQNGISCSSMGIPFGACELPRGATYGVNANIFCDEKDRLWLLGYLNSSLVTYFVRGVLLRTNMITSGYVSRIPIIPISSDGKRQLSQISAQAVRNKIQRPAYTEVIADIDDIVFRESQLSIEDIREVKNFRENIMRR